MIHPHQTALMNLLQERSISVQTIRIACDCSGQRAKQLLGSQVPMTIGEYAALCHLAGLRLPMPGELPSLPANQQTAQVLANVYKVQRKSSYKPVAEDTEIMLAIARARQSIMVQMPDMQADHTLNGEAWAESAAAALWSAAGGTPEVALGVFCTRMSLAVLGSMLASFRVTDRRAILRYLANHDDALATPYDFVVRFAPQRVERCNAMQIYAKWLAAQNEAQQTETDNA